jgi:hypothetical protein
LLDRLTRERPATSEEHVKAATGTPDFPSSADILTFNPPEPVMQPPTAGSLRESREGAEPASNSPQELLQRNRQAGDLIARGTTEGLNSLSTLLPGGLLPGFGSSSPARAEGAGGPPARAGLSQAELSRGSAASAGLPTEPADIPSDLALAAGNRLRDVRGSSLRGGSSERPSMPPTEDRLSVSSDTIYVASDRPAGVPVPQWADTLAEAFMQAAANPQIRVIELQESLTVSAPVSVPRNGLTLKSAGGRRFELRFSLDPMFGNGDAAALIQVGERQFACAGVAVSYRHQSAQDPAAVFALTPGGQLDLLESSVVVTSNHEEAQLYAILIGVPVERGTALGEAMPGSAAAGAATGQVDAAAGRAATGNAASSLATASDPVAIRIREGQFLGRQSLLRLFPKCRTEITLDRVFASVEGRVLMAGGTSLERMPSTVRLMLERSTLATGQGFAMLQAGGSERVPVALNRNASDCVFWSPPTIPHIYVDGIVDTQTLEDALLLSGKNNAYDQNIETLCQSRTARGAIENYSFMNAPGTWYGERFNDLTIRWQNLVPPERPLEEHTPEDFRLRPGMFVPGYAPLPPA